jgi:putative membrane protein
MRKITVTLACVAAATMLPMAAVAVAGTPEHHSQHSSQRLNSQDKEYLKDSAQGALFEIKGGLVAQTHAVHNFTKTFGARMIKDHSAEYRDVVRTAKKVHKSVPKSPDEVQQHDLKLLATLSGATFDCAYLSTEWADHMADVSEAKLELATGHNEEVKELAAKYLPVLKEHLSMAEQDLQRLHSCGSSSTGG